MNGCYLGSIPSKAQSRCEDVHILLQATTKNKLKTFNMKAIKKQRINTVEKFLNISLFNRGENYPSKLTLKTEMKKYIIPTHIKWDIVGFFLYSNLRTN